METRTNNRMMYSNERSILALVDTAVVASDRLRIRIGRIFLQIESLCYQAQGVMHSAKLRSIVVNHGWVLLVQASLPFHGPDCEGAECCDLGGPTM